MEGDVRRRWRDGNVRQGGNGMAQTSKSVVERKSGEKACVIQFVDGERREAIKNPSNGVRW